MTTQIVVLNKNGVALASDSVVTIEKDGAAKTLNNARKMHALPEPHRVVVLDAGRGEINNLPVSLYVLRWAKSLKQPLTTPKAYAEDFVDWLAAHAANDIFTDSDAIRATAIDLLIDISRSIHTEVSEAAPRTWDYNLKNWLEADKNNAKTYAKAVRSVLDTLPDKLERAYTYTFFNVETAEKSLPANVCKTLVNEWFGEKSLSPSQRQKLVETLPLSLAKRVNLYNEQTTFTFVGYGSNSYTPSAVSIIIEAIMPKMVRGWFSNEIDAIRGATIFYPAQRDAVRTFLNGYDDALLENLPSFIRDSIFEVLQETLESEPKAAKTLDDLIKQHVAIGAISQKVKQKVSFFGEEHYANLIDTLEVMDLSSLAEVAESLAGMQILAAHNSNENPNSGGIIEVSSIDIANGVTWHRKIPLTKTGISNL